jgi:hypothetical protein
MIADCLGGNKGVLSCKSEYCANGNMLACDPVSTLKLIVSALGLTFNGTETQFGREEWNLFTVWIKQSVSSLSLSLWISFCLIFCSCTSCTLFDIHTDLKWLSFPQLLHFFSFCWTVLIFCMKCSASKTLDLFFRFAVCRSVSVCSELGGHLPYHCAPWSSFAVWHIPCFELFVSFYPR